MMTRFFLLCKRQLIQPAFLLLCLLLPILCPLIRHLEKGSDAALSIGLYKENTDLSATASNADTVFLESVFSSLSLYHGSMTFQIFTDKAVMLDMTARNELDCAYEFSPDLHTKLMKNNYKNSITCYISPSTLIKELSRETIFSVLFQELGQDIAIDYLNNSGLFASSQTDTAEQLSHLYENYKNSDKVFSLTYQYLNTPTSSYTAPSAAAMPIRGFIAVLLFISGLSGGITWLSDQKHKLPISAFHAILIPLLFMTLSACVSLFLSGEAGNWDRELLTISIYNLLILLFVRLLLCFIKNPDILSATIPFFTLGSLIFCPVFINLGAILPLFRILEKFFLPYYYLRLSI